MVGLDLVYHFLRNTNFYFFPNSSDKYFSSAITNFGRSLTWLYLGHRNFPRRTLGSFQMSINIYKG